MGAYVSGYFDKQVSLIPLDQIPMQLALLSSLTRCVESVVYGEDLKELVMALNKYLYIGSTGVVHIVRRDPFACYVSSQGVREAFMRALEKRLSKE